MITWLSRIVAFLVPEHRRAPISRVRIRYISVQQSSEIYIPVVGDITVTPRDVSRALDVDPIFYSTRRADQFRLT